MLDAQAQDQANLPATQAQAMQVQRFPEAMGAVADLAPLYQAYRQAWAQLLAGIRRTVQGVPPPLQETTLLLLQKQMPAVVGEEELRALVQEKGVRLQGEAGLWAGAVKTLGDFAHALVPGMKLGGVSDVEKLLVRAATVLETSARAFVELRQGQEQFGTEMAVRTAGEMTPLHRAKDAREVLAYLLDLHADVTLRIQEMTSAYADVMMHQLALLNGMMEGVRSLLQRLGPAELERELKSRGGLVFWPFKRAALWRHFVQRHREYTEEEKHLSAAVFGNEFARAYSAVVGEEPAEASSRVLLGKPA
jgi:type VI secretion system protein